MKYTNAVEIQNRRINLIYESIVNEGVKDALKNAATVGLAGSWGGAIGALTSKTLGKNDKIGTTIGGAVGGALAGGGAQAAYDKFVNKRNVSWGRIGGAALGGAAAGGGVGYAMGDSKPDAKVEPPENQSGPGEQSDDFAPGVEPHGTDYKNPRMTGGRHEGPSTPEYIKPDDKFEGPLDRDPSNDVKPTDANTSKPNGKQTSSTTSETSKTTPKQRNALGRSADNLLNGNIRKAGDDFVQAGDEFAKKTANKAIGASREAAKTVGRAAVDLGSTAIDGAKKVSSNLVTGLKNVGSAIFN